MKKYLSFFRMKFMAGIQYRVAALAGIITQYAWGGMEILIYRCFYLENQATFPMEMQALSSYIWLQQGFLALFSVGMFENDIFQSITKGDVAYELCRPCDLYFMWFFRNVGTRLSRALLRCVPIFVVAIFIPKPYGLGLPASPEAAVLFFLAGIAGFFNVIAFVMIIYISTFYMLSMQGMKIFCIAIVEMFSGSIIPIPFLPDGLRQVVELLPFAALENVPLRIYGGDIAGIEAMRAILLQVFWLVVLICVGRAWMQRALKQVVVQGG